jgi:hypothetical protein
MAREVLAAEVIRLRNENLCLNGTVLSRRVEILTLDNERLREENIYLTDCTVDKFNRSYLIAKSRAEAAESERDRYQENLKQIYKNSPASIWNDGVYKGYCHTCEEIINFAGKAIKEI